ncbi:subtilisin-like protein [Lactarius psammicola]|nr:subtilisin-like protein [Lactarius psammicola]
MHHYLLYVLSILAIALPGRLATPLSPPWAEMRVKHAWNTVPENWEHLENPPAGTTIDLHLALRSYRENALIDALYEISNPRHSRYGKHLSKEQVADLVAPHPDTLELIGSWLEHYGIPSSSISTTLGGNWLMVTGVPVSQANDILGSSYQLYHHVETNDTVLRTISYSLPEALHGHIQTVVPTTYFGSPLTEGKIPRMRPSATVEVRAKAGSGELVTVSSRDKEERVTPADLRWLYKTMGYVPAAPDRNALGIAGYLGQWPSPQDLEAFMNEYRSDGVDATFEVVRINGGGYDPSNPGIEGSLDIQYAEAVAYPTRHIFYSTAGTPLKDDPFVHWFKYMLEKENIPQTISTSHSGYEYGFPPDYAVNVCKLFAQLGARGVSVLFSSGNNGVGKGDCIVKHASGKTQVRFLPTFPSTCPFVTSVGGTTGGLAGDTTGDTTSISPEVAASFSTGGFSNYFARPPYQDEVVPAFIHDLNGMYDGLYSANGRGFPDVSAQAVMFSLIFRGQPAFVSGTSGSVPTVAAIISLLNDYLISKGEKPLGFLNPWLYDGGLTGFNDITSGWNPGCNTPGFPAIAGWDPVTGLGTPNFEKLEEIIDNRLKNSGGSKTEG